MWTESYIVCVWGNIYQKDIHLYNELETNLGC